MRQACGNTCMRSVASATEGLSTSRQSQKTTNSDADRKLHTVDAEGTSVVVPLRPRLGREPRLAPGFAGRDMPRWSRKMIALGRKPSPLATYAVTVSDGDVYVEL